jgi:hypothetical protein
MTARAKIQSQPLRGAGPQVRVKTEALLLIPGRPQSRLRDDKGNPLIVGQRYLEYVRRLARRHYGNTPLVPGEPLALKLSLYYGFDSDQVEHVRNLPAIWHLHNIPRADTAPGIILSGLAGHLYSHVGQVQPLTVVRIVVSSEECAAQFGSRCTAGAAVVEHG